MGAEDDNRITVTGTVRIPRHEIHVTFSPSGGPGGQHANKASTRVELRFNVAMSSAFSEAQRDRVIDKLGDELRVVADDHRSQFRNREVAESRLVHLLRDALAVRRKRRPTRRTRGSNERRLQAKQRRSSLKNARRRPTTDDC